MLVQYVPLQIYANQTIEETGGRYAHEQDL